jgi:hypothetical protein
MNQKTIFENIRYVTKETLILKLRGPKQVTHNKSQNVFVNFNGIENSETLV